MQICLWTKFFALLELVALNTLASDVHVAVNVSQTNTVPNRGMLPYQHKVQAHQRTLTKDKLNILPVEDAEALMERLIDSLDWWENWLSYHVTGQAGECFWDDEGAMRAYAKIQRTCERGRRAFYKLWGYIKGGYWYCAYNALIIKSKNQDLPDQGLDPGNYYCKPYIIPPYMQLGNIGPGGNGVTKKVAGGTPGGIRGVSSCYVCSDPTANCEKNCGTVIRCSDANPTLPPETEYVCTEVTAAGHVARGCLRKQEADMIFGDKDCAEGAQGQQKMCQCYTDVCNSGLLEGHDTCEA